MANTTNIDLVKPAGTDHALVSVLNANSDKIDAEAGNVRSNFALVQNTNTATQAISKDQLVVWKGVLKKATSNIANGATLSNSNLSDTKVSTELAALSDQIANYKWTLIKTNIVTGDTQAFTGYDEYLVALMTSNTVYATCVIPERLAGAIVSVKFIKSDSSQVEAYYNGTSWIVANGYFAELYGRKM